MKRFFQFLLEAAMSTSDALKVLKLSPNFTPDQLKTAYKQAAVANHPDRGGDLTTMQRINAARDVLAAIAGKTTNTTQHTQPRYDDEDDGVNWGVHPRSSDIRYMQVYEMFRRELNADVRSKVGDGQIRVPIMSDGEQLQRNDARLFIILNRSKNMIGTEYVVKGIYEARGSGLKAVVHFTNVNEDMAVWESKRSIMWLIEQINKLMSLNKTDLTEIGGKLQEILKYYHKNQSKIDNNIR